VAVTSLLALVMAARPSAPTRLIGGRRVYCPPVTPTARAPRVAAI
jgi:hypothetical protein